MIREYKLDTKKYPWLISKYEAWDEDGNPEIREYEILDGLPEGWLISFGDLLCEDLDKVIKRDNLTDFRIDEAKEKWGEMRIYASGYNEEAEKIIEDYAALSGNICMICGKPDVYMTCNGWYFPCCKECWEKETHSPLPYEKVLSDNDDGYMSNSRKFRRYHNEDIKYDLTETADRIRAYWNERFGND